MGCVIYMIVYATSTRACATSGNVTRVTDASSGTYTSTMRWRATLPKRLHWRAQQRDVVYRRGASGSPTVSPEVPAVSP